MNTTSNEFLFRSPRFLRSNSMFTPWNSAQLPSCSYDRAFGHRQSCSKVEKFSKSDPSSLVLSQFSATRQSEMLGDFHPHFSHIDVTGIADIPYRASPLAMNFSEVMLSSAWVRSRFVDYHKVTQCLRFATSIFRMLERTLTLQIADPALKETLKWMPQITGSPFEPSPF